MRPHLTLKRLALATALVAGSSAANAALLLNEGFNGGIPSNWFISNQSSAVSGPAWFAGSGDVDHFPAQGGAANAYAATSVFVGATDSNGDPTGMVDAYLFSPTISLARDLTLTFYTRTLTGNAYGESLGVYAVVGSSAIPMVFVNDNGNSNPVAGQFPEVWTQYTATLTGLGAGVTGNILFNYYIPDASTAGNYIGLDTVIAHNAPEPGAWLGASALLLALGASRRRR